MNTSYQLEAEPSGFLPISGSWQAMPAGERDRFGIEVEIALDLEARHARPFRVHLYHADGRAIVDDCPAHGTLLAVPG